MPSPPDQTEPCPDRNFPTVEYGEWRRRVEAELGEVSFDEALVHRTREGLEVQPLYTAEHLPADFDGEVLPGEAPFTRGRTATVGRSGVESAKRLVSVTEYHDAGATAVQELAFALASGVEALRNLGSEGLGIDAAAAQIELAFSIGRDFFLEIAKLRAARLLWSKVVRAAGGSEAAQALPIHARTSAREATIYDPRVNLLRTCSQTMAAILGGADSIFTAPHEEAFEAPTETSQRLARNIQHILAEEAHLGRVIDAAGGSWYIESLTDSLARAAWKLFQDLERLGGMARCLADGEIARLVSASAAELRRDAATRREPVIGVSAFANLAEETPESADGTANAEPSAAKPAAPLERIRLAAPFEALRRAGDVWLRERGARPRAMILALDAAAGTDAQVAFARRLLAVAGIEAAPVATDTLPEETPPAVVLCGRGVFDAAVVGGWAETLRGRGARHLLLAAPGGEHEDALRAAGIDQFVFDGCDVEAALRDLLAALGVTV